MTKEKILNALEDALDVDQNSLSLEMNLSDIEAYDSMAKLAVIVLADDDFGKKLTGEQIRAFITVEDIVDFLSA
jgi:acyl carrier protein